MQYPESAEVSSNLAANLKAVIGAMVPVYRLDGAVERWMTSKGVLALERADKVTVVRNRKGVPLRAFRRREDKSTNLSTSVYQGTRYSYRERLLDGHVCHDLTRLDGKRRGINYAPESVRPIFLQVLSDITRTAAA